MPRPQLRALYAYFEALRRGGVPSSLRFYALDKGVQFFPDFLEAFDALVYKAKASDFEETSWILAKALQS